MITYVSQDICAERKTDSKQGAIGKGFPKPFYQLFRTLVHSISMWLLKAFTHLAKVPGRPGIEQHTTGNGAVGTSPSIDDTDLPLATLNEWEDGVAEIDLV